MLQPGGPCNGDAANVVEQGVGVGVGGGHAEERGEGEGEGGGEGGGEKETEKQRNKETEKQRNRERVISKWCEYAAYATTTAYRVGVPSKTQP